MSIRKFIIAISAFVFCTPLSAMSLFQVANLSQAAKDALVVHFDATMGVTTVPGEQDVDSWVGMDGNGAPVLTANYAGPGAFGDLIWTGSAVRFAETTDLNNSRLEATLPTGGNQFTVFWRGFYSSANGNGAQNAGLYAYNITNLSTSDAPGINHQRDDRPTGYVVEVYPGLTSAGQNINEFDDTSTVWTTVYDYANNDHSAYANWTDLNLAGGSSFTLPENPTLLIGAYDNGTYFGGSGFNFLGDIEQLIVFDAVLSPADIMQVQLFLGLQPNYLTLSIDRQTGGISLANSTPDPVDISGYTLSSPGGFDRDNWTPIAAGDAAWQVTGEPTDDTLSESTSGAKTIAPGASISLGTMDVWRAYFDEEVAMTLLDGAGQPLEVVVEFGPLGGSPFEFGDINFSGGVPDISDWLHLQTFYGTQLSGLSTAEAYGMGDLNGDGIHSLDDLQAFRNAFAQAGGNLDSLALTQVPEPKSLALAGLLLVLVGVLRSGFTLRSFVGRTSVALVALAFSAGLAEQSQAGLFDEAQLSSDAQGKLLIHFDASVGVETMGTQVEAWNGYNGTGQFVAKATLSGVGNGDSITTNGTSVVFNETTAADDLHLQVPLATSGNQYTIFWRGHYDSTNQNGAANQGIYAYSLLNLNVMNSPGLNHQRDDFGGSYRIEAYPGTTYGGDSIAAYDNTNTTWTTVYDYANSTHRAYANGKNLNLGGGSSLSLTTNPTLVIGAFDNGFAHGGSAYNFLGEMQHLIVFEGVLSPTDIAAVESFLGPALPTLTVNTVTGEMTIAGGAEMATFNGYEILSASESLLPTNWLTQNFSAQNIDPMGAAAGENWDVFSATDAQLTEAYFFGGSPFDENRTVSIGNAFNTEGTRDITFSYQTTEGQTRFGVVEYVSALTGDFNSDGMVNLADYTVWRDSLGASGSNLPADADGDGTITAADYSLWKSNFGKSSSGTLAAGAVGVPEPSTVLVLCVTLGFSLALGRAGRRS